LQNSKVLFVGVGEFQRLAITQLKEAGFYIIGVDGNPNACGQDLCNEFQAIDFTLVDEIVSYGRNKKADFAFSIECDPALNIVNTYNKLTHNNAINEAACNASNDKFIVRTLQKKLKLPHPLFFQINSLEALKYCIEQHNNSITEWVLKPKSSSGSRGVILLNNTSDLAACYRLSTSYSQTYDEGLILEQFISGEEIAIDGFIEQGQLHALTISYKERTPAPYLLDKGLFVTAQLNSSLFKQCQQQLKTMFTALSPTLSAPFHVEMIRGTDKLFIVEFSFRGAGFNVFSKWIPKVTGLDTVKILQQQTQLHNDISFQVSTNNSVYIGFFSGKQGVLKKVSGIASIKALSTVLEFKFYPNIGDTITELTSGADRIGHVVLSGNNHEELKKQFEDINNTLELEYE
jgi:phosphoribosylaminoimidazole carboxylase (NCAIR synthetase)